VPVKRRYGINRVGLRPAGTTCQISAAERDTSENRRDPASLAGTRAACGLGPSVCWDVVDRWYFGDRRRRWRRRQSGASTVGDRKHVRLVNCDRRPPTRTTITAINGRLVSAYLSRTPRRSGPTDPALLTDTIN